MKVRDEFLSGELFSLENTAYGGVLKTAPTPDDIEEYYQSEAYISHHQKGWHWRVAVYKLAQWWGFKYKYKILSPMLSSESRLLDYGCGSGAFLNFMEGKVRAFGLEKNKNALRNLKENGAISLIDDLSCASEKFDIITLWHVFEHLKDPVQMLGHFHHALKDEGVLVLACPNYKSWDAQYYREFWAAYDVPRHLYHYSPEGMRAILEENGFQIKQVHPMYLDAFYVAVLSEKYKKSTFSFLKGVLFGAISNFKAIKTRNFSSLIYVVEKTNKAL